MKYFIVYEATALLGREEKYLRTFRNNIEIDYPLISSQKDVESIENQLKNYLFDIYDGADLPAEITGITLLHFIRFENDYSSDHHKIQ